LKRNIAVQAVNTHFAPIGSTQPAAPVTHDPKEVILTMHLRQPLPTARLDSLIEEAQASRAPGYVYRDGLKRIFDIFLVLITALPVLIVLGALCLVIMLDGKSPIYVQKRVGRNGRIFKMYKLRSMISNADDVLHAYL